MMLLLVAAFAWRGSHLDVARHFMPVDYIKHHLDRMQAVGLNVFHFHLTDDQGWRIHIDAYPRLTEDQAHYTQAEVRDIVAYATARGIMVVPEIEMPGHARAALSAYPFVGNEPLRWQPIPTRWGVFEEVFGTQPETFVFLEDVLREVIALFPAPYVHVGGDEVLAGDYAGFMRHIHRWLGENGRRMVAWDEILDAGLPCDVIVMAWRDVDKTYEALNAGHEVVMAPVTPLYLDKPRNSLEMVRAFRPVAHPRVLGAQAQLWTEYLATPEDVERAAWPRLQALAEALRAAVE